MSRGPQWRGIPRQQLHREGTVSQKRSSFSLIRPSQQPSPLAATLEQFDRMADDLQLDAVLQAIQHTLYPDRRAERLVLAWCRSDLP
jgi:hypothetical protein